MTHQERRCRHCHARYCYQGSGHGCFDPENDHDYCPDCKKIILTAMESVPIKIRSVFLPTKDFTAEQLLEIQARKEAEIKARGGICFVRCRPGLARVDDKGNLVGQRIISVDVDKKQYVISFWEDKPEEKQVLVLMEQDVQTGKVLDYWYDL